MNSSSCVDTTTVILILFPSYNNPTSNASLKNYKLIYLWFLTSILRFFTFSKYPLPSEINGKLMLFETRPLKGCFEWLKVFYITIKDLAALVPHLTSGNLYLATYQHRYMGNRIS